MRTETSCGPKGEKLAWFWFSVRIQTVKTWTVPFERPGKITEKIFKNGSPWQSYIAFHWVCLKIGYLLIVSHSICTYGYLRPSCGLPFFSAARNHQKPSFFSHSPYHFVGIPWYPHDIPMVSNPMGIQCTLRMRSTKSELWELFRDAFDKLQPHSGEPVITLRSRASEASWISWIFLDMWWISKR